MTTNLQDRAMPSEPPNRSTASGGDATIRVRGVVKHYGEVRALDGVDLEAAAGTVLGLLGPNGAGKTTAVRMLTTLLEPDAGESARRRARRASATRRGCAADRARRPVRGGRREPHRRSRT